MNEEIPLRCKQCHYTNMVQFGNLTKRPLDKVVTAEGYICQHCGKWEPVCYKTVSLYELLERIERLSIGSGKRKRLWQKAMKKAKNLQERIRRDLRNGSR